MEYQGCGEEYSVEKKGKGAQYHLPYNISAVWKNNRSEIGKGDLIGEDIKVL